MTLARRLLLAIGAVTLAATFFVGYFVRDAWRDQEEERFNAEFQAALESLRQDLADRAADLSRSVDQLCSEPLVDDALVGLLSGDIATRRLSLSVRVPEHKKARGLDELTLITWQGDILGADRPGLVGTRDKTLAARLASKHPPSGVRALPPVALEHGCRKVDEHNPRIWVGLYAARRIDELLTRVGKSYGVGLTLESVRPEPQLLQATISLPELGGVPLTATRSRTPLTAAIEHIDAVVLGLGTLSVLAALGFAYLLARGLSRPIVELSRQARAVVHGEPKPVTAQGGRELEELAHAFNATLRDLVALRKRLAVSERIAARREIARQVAHEIKNPLAPVRAAVETLRRLRARNNPAFDEYFDEATRTVLDEVARISNIVTEFTRFARLPPPEPAPIDLVETVRSVVSLHSAIGVPISFEADELPAVTADRDQLVQVMTNLLSNAADALRGQGTGKIEVRVKLDGDVARIHVRDNGPGVHPDMRERLFEPYATNKPDGTGLGLAIVQRIAIEHGGGISYRDDPAGGAVFEVELPLNGPTLLPEPPRSSRLSGTSGRPS